MRTGALSSYYFVVLSQHASKNVLGHNDFLYEVVTDQQEPSDQKLDLWWSSLGLYTNIIRHLL